MNLLELPPSLPPEEWTEILAHGKGFRIERIISAGQVSPEGFLYDQAEDEWVLVLQGEARLALYDAGVEKTVRLCAGDFLYIPARQKHCVTYTSKDVPCIWFCIFKQKDSEKTE